MDFGIALGFFVWCLLWICGLCLLSAVMLVLSGGLPTYFSVCLVVVMLLFLFLSFVLLLIMILLVGRLVGSSFNVLWRFALFCCLLIYLSDLL